MHEVIGPHERVNRAKREIATLQENLAEFFKDNLYEIDLAEYNSKADNYSLRVKSGPQDFPVDWSLLIGEIAHNLRSALDGLAWQLALLGPGEPYDRTAFPICRVRRGKRRRRRSLGFHRQFWEARGDLLKSVDRRFWTRIEAFQPHKRRNGGRLSPLFLLSELNNTDKHRLLTVLSILPASMSFSGLTGGTRFYLKVPLRPNAKVGWVRDVPPNEPGPNRGAIYLFDPATGTLMEPEMQVNIDVAPGVVFGDTCQAVQRLPVIPTLQRMANEASRIIETFSEDLT